MKASFLLTLSAMWLQAAQAAPGNVTSSIDAGGQRASSANYSQFASISSLSGTSAQSANVTSKPSFIGQIYTANGAAIVASRLTVPETQTVQFNAFAHLDDGSLLAIPSTTLPTNLVVWTSPLLTIDDAGLGTATAVYQDEANVQVSATWNGFTASLPSALTILNTLNDNFAPYDADTINDAWQVLHFGLNDPLHGRGHLDPDSDGTSNVLEWAAGTDPLSATSKLGFLTHNAQNDGGFQTTFTSVVGKSYRIQRSTDLQLWTTIATVTATDVITAYTDAPAPVGKAFYRIEPVLAE